MSDDFGFTPNTPSDNLGFVEEGVKNYTPPPAPNQQGVLDKLANSSVVTGINAIGGGTQQALANTIGTAVGSPGITDALSPPTHVQEAMIQDPRLAMAGKAVGYIGAGAAATGAATGAAAAVFGDGLLTSLGANAVAGSVLAGPNNRLLGAGIGAGTAAIAPAISSTINYTAKSSTLATRLKSLVTDINSKIEGTPDQVAAKSQANMWSTADSVDKQNFSFLDNANKITTVPEQAANQAKAVLNKYEDPKILGDLTGTQRQLVEQIADWSKQETKSLPASAIVDATGNALQGQTDQIINSSTKFSLADLQNARKGLDQAISQAFNQSENGAISKGVAHDLLSIRAPIEQDLLQAATKAGMKDQYLAANEYYKGTMLPLINAGARDTAEALKNMGTDPLAAGKITDGLINRYIKADKPDVAKSFLNTLDPIGRQAVEAQVINNALKKATNNIDKVDPLVFKTTIKDVQSKLGSVFSKDTNDMLIGLNRSIDQGTKLLGMTIDTAKIQAGYKIGAAASLLGTVAYNAGAGAAGALGGVLLGLHTLINSKIGQQMLIKAGSKGGEEIGKDIVNGLLIQGALAVTPPDLKEPPQ